MMQKLKNDALWCKSAKNLAICFIYEASINLWCDLTTLVWWKLDGMFFLYLTVAWNCVQQLWLFFRRFSQNGINFRFPSESKNESKNIFTALRLNSYVRWDDSTPACLVLIKCNFDIGTQQPTLTFPAGGACLSVSQKSVVDMWQCLRLLTVNPRCPTVSLCWPVLSQHLNCITHSNLMAAMVALSASI